MKAEGHPVLRYEARGHAQAGSGGAGGETTTGDWPAPKRRELWGDCRSGWAQPDRCVSQTGVFDICKRFAASGKKGLVSGKRGRKPDEQRLLTAAQEREIKRLVCRHMPEELGLDFELWSREAVRALIRCQYGVRLAVRTSGKYLARWGFTAQKPLRRAYEQNPAEVRDWLRHEYPAIVARARRTRGVIFWGDETGLRADDVRGRSYAPPGKT